jgi:hypothetical protein
MDVDNGYNYSSSQSFLSAFKNPFPNKEFIEDMPENYGFLWCFKDCVRKWSLGISKFKKYVYLLHQEQHRHVFLPLNINEKVTLVEPFHQEYILIGLRAVDEFGVDLDHIHSIVVKVGSEGAQFDLHGFVSILPGTAMEGLAPQLWTKYSPWSNSSAEAVYRRLNHILQTTIWYVSKIEVAVTAPQERSAVDAEVGPHIQTTSVADGGSISSASAGARSRASPRVRLAQSVGAAQPVQKRQKSIGTGGSSASIVTHVEGRRQKSPVDTTSDYERHAETHAQFWESCGDCFCFGQATFEVNINQCILARDEYIIRKLEGDIVKSVMAELVQLGDVNQRQKVCLTPIDPQGRLLRAKPQVWDDIKKGKFMIINGQHSIAASKHLQEEGCVEKRRKELATWEAYIVWSLDPLKLHDISKFYNSTNHLRHAQPTWGWQLISGRNIWITQGRPTDKAGEADVRGNGAVLSPSKYAVRTVMLSNLFHTLHHPPVKNNCEVLWLA